MIFDFHHGMVSVARWSGLSISETDDHPGFSKDSTQNGGKAYFITEDKRSNKLTSH